MSQQRPNRTSRPRVEPDWTRAARLLAEGASLSRAAEAVGCSRQRLARKRDADPEFARAAGLCAEEGARAASGRRGSRQGARGALASEVLAALEREVQGGNVRVTMWLADKLGLLEDGPAPRDAILDRFEQVADTLGDDDLAEFTKLGSPPDDA